MQRHRQISASPVRSSTQTWTAIVDLVTVSLARSPYLLAAEVASALDTAQPAGMMLIAAGHLERDPLVLVAATLHLSITTVSGEDAFSVEENSEPVPGAAEARDWVLHLPTPDPIGDFVSSIAAANAHLSSAPAPAEAAAAAASTGASATRSPAGLNLEALAAREARR